MDIKKYKIFNAIWFNCTKGIYKRKYGYELNVTVGHQVSKYLGNFKTEKEAINKRKEWYINLFIHNLNNNNISIDTIKQIVDHPNYFCSSNGYILNKFGLPLKGMVDRCGYHQICIDNKFVLVHRIILKTFCPNDNYKKLDVNHIDGNKTNNSLENLEWCTRSYNVKHSYKNKLQDNVAGRPIVDEEKEKEFKNLRNSGKTYKEISLLTGYNEKTIRNHINKYNKGEMQHGNNSKRINKQ